MGKLIALFMLAVLLVGYPFYGSYLPFGPLSRAAQPSARPRPTGTPAPPTPSPTPEAWRTDPQHPINLFVAFMKADDATYHVATTITAAYLTKQAAAGESIDVRGTDYADVFTSNTESGVQKIRAIRVGTRRFLKEGTAPWVEYADITPDNLWGATNNDTYSTLKYVGPETRDGKPVDHVVLSVAGWPLRSSEYLLITQLPSNATWDVWIDDAGHPLYAQMQAQFHGVVEQRAIPISMLFQYAFSDAGKPVTIEMPAGFE